MRINFSHNWNNKLNCEYFTTVRKYNFAKEKYYFEAIGKIFDVYVNNKFFCKAMLVDVWERKFKELPEFFLILDAGENWNEIFKKFGIGEYDPVLILLFKREEKECDESER